MVAINGVEKTESDMKVSKQISIFGTIERIGKENEC